MSGQDDDSDKQFEATPKKLEEARKKGELARSADLVAAGTFLGVLVVAVVFGGPLVTATGTELKRMFATSPELAADLFAGAPRVTATRMFGMAILSLIPWFVLPPVFAIGSAIAQRALVIAPSKISPKSSRLNPLSNAKSKFGRQGLFEFFKSFSKLVVFSIVLGLFLVVRTEQILVSIRLEPEQITLILGAMLVEFLTTVLVVMAAIGAVDFLWQRAEHMRRHRMTRKELMDESKQTEGDPQMKQQRRQRAREIAANRMLADIPGSDVVIVNPTHYAVVLKWSRRPGAAPVCVAKGADAMAARIRAIAAEAGVPLRRDPPTARAIFATVEIGQEIDSEHYRAVAAAIRFAERMRRHARPVGP